MSKGKLFLVGLYALVLLVGIGLIIGGGSILWAETFMKDSDGFYMTRKVDLERNSYAVTSYPADIDIEHLGGVLGWVESIEVKLTAENNKNKGAFVGISQENDLQNYLSGVNHDQIDELDLNHPVGEPEISYKNFPGDSSPAAPAEEDFWTAHSAGTGEQVLKWGVEEGEYSVILMNQDASSGVDISASVGADFPIASGLGLWLFVAGLVVALLSFIFFYVTVSRSEV